jgi:hypothetical protein
MNRYIHIRTQVRQITNVIFACTVFQFTAKIRNLRVLAIQLVGETANSGGQRLNLAFELGY